MTKEEFLKTSFVKGDKAIYASKEYPIISVDIDEMLIGLLVFQELDDAHGISWVRCENIEFIPFNNQP